MAKKERKRIERFGDYLILKEGSGKIGIIHYDKVSAAKSRNSVASSQNGNGCTSLFKCCMTPKGME